MDSRLDEEVRDSKDDRESDGSKDLGREDDSPSSSRHVAGEFLRRVPELLSPGNERKKREE